jgi:hypothetical protein
MFSSESPERRPPSRANPPQDTPPRRHSTSAADPRHGPAALKLIHTVNSIQLARRLTRPKRHSALSLTQGASTRSVHSQEMGFSERINEQIPLKQVSSADKEEKQDNGIEEEPDAPLSTARVIFVIVFGKGPISWCLAAAPLALLAVHLKWSDTWIFWLTFTTILPLAAILGDFTEELALHTNETIGGLINASFGNAVEVVVAINALMAGQIRVVQASLLGSIFSNLLLVLGCCFFFGGLVHKVRPPGVL